MNLGSNIRASNLLDSPTPIDDGFLASLLGFPCLFELIPSIKLLAFSDFAEVESFLVIKSLSSWDNWGLFFDKKSLKFSFALKTLVKQEVQLELLGILAWEIFILLKIFFKPKWLTEISNPLIF